MEVRVDPRIMDRVLAIEGDVSKAVSEALVSWLKERVPTCPITENLCRDPKGSCNECPETDRFRLPGEQK